MRVYTDSIQYAEKLLGVALAWNRPETEKKNSGLVHILNLLFQKNRFFQCDVKSTPLWKYLVITGSASESQYDVLVRLTQDNVKIPDGTICLAAEGSGFHGFKNRTWKSLAGNLHLTIFLSPMQIIPHFGAAFMVLPAVSVIQTIDTIPGLENRTTVKWVNDILIDGAKVCGVLAHSQTVKKTVTGVILGMGLNVEVKPVFEPDEFVRRATSLWDVITNKVLCNQAIIFKRLIQFLENNYSLILSGDYFKLLDIYRQRSCVVGKEVTIFLDEHSTDSVSGVVTHIGENLELSLHGVIGPVTRGRLIFKE